MCIINCWLVCLSPCLQYVPSSSVIRIHARCEKKSEAHDMIIESRCSLIIVDHPELSERCSAKFLFFHISLNFSTAISYLPYCRYSSEIKWLFFGEFHECRFAALNFSLLPVDFFHP